MASVQIQELVGRAAQLGRPLNLLSLGAGVQSSTLALMGAAGEVQPFDGAIFADTQHEPKAVMSWLDYLEGEIAKMPHPFQIHRVTAGSLAARELRVRVSKKSGKKYLQSGIPAFVLGKEGKVGILGRKCTRDFKITPIIQQARKLAGITRAKKGMPVLVRQAIGISWDEVERMKSSLVPWIESYWPLIDLKMTREDCKAWMFVNGYPEPPRSACTFCPFHSDYEWIRLRTEAPHEFAEAAAFERELQARGAGILRGAPYLHRSCVPLDQVEFKDAPNPAHLDQFKNECEGLCGV